MEFFTSPEDLKGWVKSQESSDSAAQKLMEIIGPTEEQDVVETCKAIFDTEDNNASEILFEVLARHNLANIREGKMKDNKLKKEAQGIYRGEAPFYESMPLRICPKLPKAGGPGMISTTHCRENCLDSIVLDDNPLRVYCAEALWRRHVADKFSSDFKNEEGKLVGGYLNERFQVFHDDGGNQMELANGERTRKPRPHQYSIERRLQEDRGEETYDLLPAVASSSKTIKTSSVEIPEENKEACKIFSDIIDMKESGLSDEDIILKVSEHYEKGITETAAIHRVAMKQLSKHDKVLYSHVNPKMTKEALIFLDPNVRKEIIKRLEAGIMDFADVPEQFKNDPEVMAVMQAPADEIGLSEEIQSVQAAASKEFKVEEISK